MCSDRTPGTFTQTHFQKRGKTKGKMEIYHFGKDALNSRKLNWTLIGEDGTVYHKGSLKTKKHTTCYGRFTRNHRTPLERDGQCPQTDLEG